MKRLTIKNQPSVQDDDWLLSALHNCPTKNAFVNYGMKKMCNLDISYYDEIGKLLSILGFKTIVTREGDVNCRFDATIYSDSNSIPIEIKSPKEDPQINIKSIRQALENKIVLLSRNFYPTTKNTTSLAIAMNYPPSRSDVYELITDIKTAWDFNIGIIDLSDLLSMVYAVSNENRHINYSYFDHLQGKLDYEKAITQ